MSTVISAPLSASLPPEPPARITVGQYHAMIAAGVFAEDEQVELLEGWLFHKMAKKATHSYSIRATRKILEKLLAPGWDVDSQEPITTIDSEPEPDVSVVRGGGARQQETPSEAQGSRSCGRSF
jgi:Uma2 family endonuclease